MEFLHRVIEKSFKFFSIIGLSFMMAHAAMADGSVIGQDFKNPPRTDVAFILVYMSTCPHCQRFDPILKAYVQSHHIPVLAYTLNGVALPSFQDSITPTQDEIQKLFPDGNPVVPSLFVIDQKHHQIIRALTGEASAAQLQDRMIQIEDLMMQNKQEPIQTERLNHAI